MRYEMNCTVRDDSSIDMPICLAEIPYSGKKNKTIALVSFDCFKIYN